MKEARYITTPIFYVNGPPHLGHASTLVVADLFARWSRFRGHKVLFMTGTDEYGTKVQRLCNNQGVPFYEHCTSVSEMFRKLAKDLNCSHDKFVRTTSANHHRVVQDVWRKLVENKMLTKGLYTGNYSQVDEAFVPSKRTQKREDGEVVNTETGETLQYVEESNYLLALLTEKVSKYIQAKHVFPEKRNEDLAKIFANDEESLKSLSVSRSRNSVYWGIEVPDDPDHTVYVWLDALTSYLTGAGYDGTNQSVEEFWPPHTQFLGKDILKFHGIFWPSILNSIGLSGPKRLAVHGHWTVEGRKMSKSRGNVIDPVHLLDSYGCDMVRFFLLTNTSFDSDCDFKMDDTREKLHQYLPDMLGNLLRRVSAKNLNPGRQFPETPSSFDEESQELLASANGLREMLEDKMEKLEYGPAIMNIMSLVRNANRYWERREPWKKGEQEKMNTIWCCVEMMRISCTALIPVIPESAHKVLDMFGIPHTERTLDHLDVGSCNHSFVDNFEGCDGLLFEKKLIKEINNNNVNNVTDNKTEHRMCAILYKVICGFFSDSYALETLLTLESLLREDLWLDELGLEDLMLYTQEKLSCELQFSQVEKCVTFGDFLSLVSSTPFVLPLEKVVVPTIWMLEFRKLLHHKDQVLDCGSGYPKDDKVFARLRRTWRAVERQFSFYWKSLSQDQQKHLMFQSAPIPVTKEEPGYQVALALLPEVHVDCLIGDGLIELMEKRTKEDFRDLVRADLERATLLSPKFEVVEEWKSKVMMLERRQVVKIKTEKDEAKIRDELMSGQAIPGKIWCVYLAMAGSVQMFLQGILDEYRKKQELIAKTKKNSDKHSFCDACGEYNAKLMICGRCKKRWYCTKTCQQQDWKEHKKKCGEQIGFALKFESND